jgi:hypothetical protein
MEGVSTLIFLQKLVKVCHYTRKWYGSATSLIPVNRNPNNKNVKIAESYHQ